LVAGLFMIYPTISFIHHWARATMPIRLWGIASILGAIPLAFALMNATRMTWAFLLRCFLIAGTLGCSMMILTSITHHHGFRLPRNAGYIAVGSLLLYLPICFVIEEVFFRGGLDSFIQKKSDKYGWVTATLLSSLWGWWHLPILHTKDWIHFIGLAISLPLIHCVVGIPFSFYWRKSGSLLVPAVVHAFIDSVRNAVM
jgi:membrane protease YdiL (CAAX protease family)